MHLSSREVVLRAIERRRPPRIPVHYCNRDYESSDTLNLGFAPAADFVASEPGMTEWGYAWLSLDETMGQPRNHPLGAWANVEHYVPPNAYAPGRFDALANKLAQSPDRFAKFGVGISGFNQATFLRGMDRFLMDLYEAPERAAHVLDLVFEFENGIIEQAVQLPIDCVAFGDDWGTQRGLMIRPALWREVFAPRYAEQFNMIHAAGKKVWFHTCGDVSAVLGDLIDLGVDVLELLQPDIYGVDWLANAFGGRVCFCCSIDHQRRAVSGTREEIFAYARYLADTLGAYDGGFIAYIEDYHSLGMSEQTYQWIREAFHSLGVPQQRHQDTKGNV